MSRPLRLHLIAGEASGDRLGAPLIRALRARREIEVHGVGGEMMQAEGLAPLFPASDLAVMGLTEVLPRLPLILRRLREAAADVAARRPDALITIDSPSFSLRVAARARRADPALRTIHYVAPSVWAWRPGRAREMARYVDHVLALLPFEPPWMEAAGMTCDCVGHPAAAMPRPAPEDVAAIRAALGAEGGPLLCVLPGSRRGELARLSPRFGETLRRLADRVPGLVTVLPAAPGLADAAREAAAAWGVGTQVLDPAGSDPAAAEARKFAAMAAADAALAASGTVSLELAALGAPHVSAYAVAPLTALIVRNIVKVPTANLVNLLTRPDAVPEFLQERFRPAAAADALARLIEDAGARAEQRAAFDAAMAALGRGGPPPSERAADSILAAIARG
ncbi:MAG TPA: lipid-A-disaccharide synthase [Paracoccaceae bacterium]|nr:lipid-A-disaccharide synthase [Paracoccaceae bacterium]